MDKQGGRQGEGRDVRERMSDLLTKGTEVGIHVPRELNVTFPVSNTYLSQNEPRNF